MALKKEFTNSRHVACKEDPDVWIGNLEDLHIRIEQQGSKMEDMDMMIHILNNMPKEYKISQAKLEDRRSFEWQYQPANDRRNSDQAEPSFSAIEH